MTQQQQEPVTSTELPITVRLDGHHEFSFDARELTSTDPGELSPGELRHRALAAAVDELNVELQSHPEDYFDVVFDDDLEKAALEDLDAIRDLSDSLLRRLGHADDTEIEEILQEINDRASVWEVPDAE